MNNSQIGESHLFGRLSAGYWVLIFIAVIEFAVGGAVGVSLGGINPSKLITLGGLRAMLPAWLILPLAWLGWVAIMITLRRMDRPAATLWRVLRRHRFWLLRGALFTAIIYPLTRAFTAYKNAMPHIVPFYADPYFVVADKLIFGTDPWRLTHALIGPIGTVVIDRIYSVWFVVMMLLIGWLNFTRNQTLQLRGLLTYMLCWAFLGNLVATALLSVGPCFYADFYHDPYFSELMAKLRASDADYPIFATRAMNYLLSSVGQDRFGAGISAMPSIHVSVAFLCFLVVKEGSKQLWLKFLAGSFAITIFVGSVHLGWHYAVDGLVSLAGTFVIWVLAGRYVDWLDGRTARFPVPRPEAQYGTGQLSELPSSI